LSSLHLSFKLLTEYAIEFIYILLLISFIIVPSKCLQ
jgi:hypothetical protein